MPRRVDGFGVGSARKLTLDDATRFPKTLLDVVHMLADNLRDERKLTKELLEVAEEYYAQLLGKGITIRSGAPTLNGLIARAKARAE